MARPINDPRALLAEALDLHQKGSLKRAEKSYRDYLALRPDDPTALIRFGILRAQAGDFQTAIAMLRRASAIAPDEAAVHYNLGRAELEAGQAAAAVGSLARALELAPGRADTLNNLANALRECGRLDEAAAHYELALMADPDQADAAYNLGLLCRQLYRLDEAVRHLAQAARLKPKDAAIHFNLAEALYRTGAPRLAAQAYAAVLDLAPDHAGALSRLVLCKRQSGDWQDLERHERAVLARVGRKPGADGTVASPFAVAAISDDPALVLTSARAAAAQIAQQQRASRLPPAHWRHDRIRVAYVAGDYREHATSYLIADLIESHDRTRFETFGISFGPEEDSPMRRRMRSAFEHFLDVRQMTPADTARLMREREIDIAVDLVGFNQFQRMALFALRPATIQVNYLGWPGTTGAKFMDYILADGVVAPPESGQFFEEAVVQLSGCYQSNDRRRRASEVTPTRAACGLPERGTVFCCFNNIYKIGPEVLDDWLAIVKSVEGSVLWLLDDSAAATANLRAEVARRGVSPDRLVTSPRLPLADHLARHRHADAFLDTFPYNAHTTASDALFMNVPVVTRRGRAFQSRVAADLLAAAGVPELVADARDAFVDLGIRLGCDDEWRVSLSRRLAENKNNMILFDTDRLRRDIEAAYAHMISRAHRGDAPAAFRIAADGSAR